MNLRLKNAKPRIVLENTSDSEISAQPKFSPLAGDQSSAVELPNLTIGPRQIVELDLSPLRQAAASRTDLDSVYAQILSSAAPGSLIGAAYSESATGLIYDVPLRDSGKVRNATGSYPWRVDNDYSTNVVLTNVGNIPAKFQVELRYPGGPYSIKQRELAVGESASFDLRAIRDEQQPDRTGKTLPETINGGQFHWSIVQTPGDARIVGRAEVVSRSQRVVSSYSCPVCCPENGPNAHFNPNAYPLYVDGFAVVGADGTYWDCYYNYYTGSASFNSLSTLNTSVATANLGSYEVQGVNPGETDVVGEYQYVYWEDDGMNCYQRFDNGQANAPVAVSAHITGLNDIWYFAGTTPAFYPTSETLNATPANATSYQWTIIQGSARATFTGGVSQITTSTNTVDLIASDKSISTRDVLVQVTVNGVTSPSFGVTVHALDRMDPSVIEDHASSDRGYNTIVWYVAKDQFGNVPPYDTYVNEYLLPEVDDYNGTDWGNGDAGNAPISGGNGAFTDLLAGPLVSSGAHPTPISPLNPLSDLKVIHIPQRWYSGSPTSGSGYLMQADIIQLYIDHGRHFNILSPVF